MSALPERIATRIGQLIESVPDAAAAPPLPGVPAPGRARGLRADRAIAGGAALRGRRCSPTAASSPNRCCGIRSGCCLWRTPGTFYRVLSVEDYRERLLRFAGRGRRSAMDFARFRRRQLLRILLRDVLGAATLGDVTEELSNLADAILDVAYRRIRAELVARHGEPRLEDGSPCGFSVISLGKLGGQELNYSSDIDLMFVYGGNGETDGPAVLTNKEFYKKVANQYTALLSTYTAEGPVLPGGPAAAAGRHAGRGLHFRGWRARRTTRRGRATGRSRC